MDTDKDKAGTAMLPLIELEGEDFDPYTADGEYDSVFRNIPPEIMQHMFTFLDERGGKFRGRFVCKRWKLLMDDPTYGRIRCIASLFCDEMAQTFLEFSMRIEVVTMTGLTKQDWPEPNSIYSFGALKSLKIGGSNSHESVMTMLKCGSKTLKSLEVWDSAFSSIETDTLEELMMNIEWTSLSSISLNLTMTPTKVENETTDNHSSCVVLLLKFAKLPVIRKFSFELTCNLGTERNPGPIMQSVVWANNAFLIRNAVTLKVVSQNFLIDQTQKSSFKLDRKDTEPNELTSTKLKLEKCSLTVTHYDALLHLVPPVLWDCKDIIVFDWNPLYLGQNFLRPSPNTLNPLYSLLRNNNLTVASIHFPFDEGGIFEMQWLDSCSSLKKLRLYGTHRVINKTARLRQVTEVEIADSPPDTYAEVTSWVVNTMKNIQTVWIFGLTLEENGDCNWLGNLMDLQKLKSISYTTVDGNNDEFDNILTQYCENFSNDQNRQLEHLVNRSEINVIY